MGARQRATSVSFLPENFLRTFEVAIPGAQLNEHRIKF